MADNYLEKRMEDYRRGAKPTASAGSRSARRQPTAFVLSNDHRKVASIVKRLCSAGMKVAFNDTDIERGRSLAQQTGSQHHPIDSCDLDAVKRSIELINSRWGHLDMTILTEKPDSTISDLFDNDVLILIEDQSI